MKVVAFLPAKGTSERIPSKNMKLLDGKPLFLHTLEKLVECDFIDEVYLDSESDEILDFADYLNYNKLKRDTSLANNKTDGHKMFYNEVKQVEADIYIQILGTSPFIKKETIKKGIKILTDNKEYDSVVLVKKEKQYLWKENKPVYDRSNIPNSVDLPDTIVESMGLYIVRKEAAHKYKQRFGENSYLLEAEPIEAVDVNLPEEFTLADYIAKGIRREKIKKLNTLKGSLNSSILSDILDEMGIKSVVPGLNINLPDKKLFGWANTLKIRKLNENEDYRGIYKGLKTYEEMRDGEVIMVQNEVPTRAYFGELNANLAVRAGTAGAIINGVTRDALEVEKLDYPVLSKGFCCADVKGVATIESFNKPISMEGININPGDLIFADKNGIVVIPKYLEDKVLEKAIDVISKEKTILAKIVDNVDAMQIYNQEGEF